MRLGIKGLCSIHLLDRLWPGAVGHGGRCNKQFVEGFVGGWLQTAWLEQVLALGIPGWCGGKYSPLWAWGGGHVAGQP
jgi:hypothetical protein